MVNGIKNLKAQSQHRALIIYLAIWLLLPLAFFSIAKGKLLTYLLPIFPAFSMLMALSMEGSVSNARIIRWRGETVGFLFLVVIVLAFVTLQVTNDNHMLFANNEQIKLAFLAAALLSGGFMLWRSMQASNTMSRTLWISATLLPFFFYWSTYIGLPREVSNRKTPSEFLTIQSPYISPDAILICDDSMFHAVAWTYKHDDIYMLYRGELSYGLSYAAAKHRNLENQALASFFENFSANQEFAIFYLGTKPLPQLAQLPENVVQIRESHIGRFNFIYLKKS